MIKLNTIVTKKQLDEIIATTGVSLYVKPTDIHVIEALPVVFKNGEEYDKHTCSKIVLPIDGCTLTYTVYESPEEVEQKCTNADENSL